MTTTPYLPAQPPAAAVFSAGPVLENERNRTAVQGLLADADRVLALTELDDVRGSREIVGDKMCIRDSHRASRPDRKVLDRK